MIPLDFLDIALKEMYRANVDKKHPFRLPVLSTCCDGVPFSRIVVHRNFSDDYKSTYFTDKSTLKVNQIEENPKISLLYYHTKKQIQLSVLAKAIVVSEGASFQQYFRNLSQYQLKDYNVIPTPGTPIQYDENVENDNQSRFCLVIADWLKLDLLQLDRSGHKRAQFIRNDGHYEGYWVAP